MAGQCLHGFFAIHSGYWSVGESGTWAFPGCPLHHTMISGFPFYYGSGFCLLVLFDQ